MLGVHMRNALSHFAFTCKAAIALATTFNLRFKTLSSVWLASVCLWAFTLHKTLPSTHGFHLHSSAQWNLLMPRNVIISEQFHTSLSVDLLQPLYDTCHFGPLWRLLYSFTFTIHCSWIVIASWALSGNGSTGCGWLTSAGVVSVTVYCWRLRTSRLLKPNGGGGSGKGVRAAAPDRTFWRPNCPPPPL